MQDFNNFLNDYDLSELTKRTYESLFSNYIKPICESKKKALYELDITTLQDIISSLPTSHSSTKQVIFNLMKNYFYYYEERGIIDYNPTDTFNIQNLIQVDTIRFKNTYIPLKDFWYWLYNNCKFDDNCKMLVAMLRYGITTNDIGAIKISDIDVDNERLYISNRDIYIKIDRMFIRLFKSAINVENMELNTSIDKDVRYLESEYIIKPTDKTHSYDEGLSLDTVYSRINYISQSLGSRIKIKDLNNSRMIDLLLERYIDNDYVSIVDCNEVLTELFGSTSDNKAFRLKQDFQKITDIKVLNAYELLRIKKKQQSILQ